MRTCTVADCGKKFIARGFCSAHYQRWSKYGDALGGPGKGHGNPTGPKPLPLEERFARHFEIDESGCWLWTGALNGVGYGNFGLGRHEPHRTRLAHRVMYELRRGPIPEGLQLDHLCRVPRCVNPDHLEPVTPAENSRRGMSPSAIAVRTNRCHRGHTLEDAYVVPRTGTRQCRGCRRVRDRKRQAYRRAA